MIVNLFSVYTAWGIENRIKDTPDFPRNAVIAGMITEMDVNLNKYRILGVIYSDSKGNIISETKYDNPTWFTATQGKMNAIWVEIARELSGGK